MHVHTHTHIYLMTHQQVCTYRLNLMEIAHKCACRHTYVIWHQHTPKNTHMHTHGISHTEDISIHAYVDTPDTLVHIHIHHLHIASCRSSYTYTCTYNSACTRAGCRFMYTSPVSSNDCQVLYQSNGSFHALLTTITQQIYCGF